MRPGHVKLRTGATVRTRVNKKELMPSNATDQNDNAVDRLRRAINAEVALYRLARLQGLTIRSGRR